MARRSKTGISWIDKIYNEEPKSLEKPISKDELPPKVYPQINASDYVVKPLKKSAYDIQMEKIARTEAFKNRSVEENLKIHTDKILGNKHAGNTDNYFVDNKTGKISTSSQTSNLRTFLNEREQPYLTPALLKPVKLVDARNASKLKTQILKKSVEIKAMGGKIPELNLLNKEQIAKYTEISNIITQSKPDDSQPATAQVGETGIEDTTVISLGFTPEDIDDFKIPQVQQTDENKDFVDKNKTSTGLMIAGLGAGLLALLYLSKRK